MKTFETEYQLQEWRRIEPEHFDCDGNAFTGQRMSGGVQEQMRTLINRLEYELILAYSDEEMTLNKMGSMCVESLSPDDFENWDNIKKSLINNRHALRGYKI